MPKAIIVARLCQISGPIALMLALLGVACSSKPADTDGAGGQPPGAEDRCDGESSDPCAGEAKCDSYPCGGPAAVFNHFGCPRLVCTADSDCPAGEACFVRAYAESCQPSEVSCGDQDGSCSCVVTDDCGGVVGAHCLPTEFYPKSGYCDVSALSCAELGERSAAIESARVFHADAGHNQLTADLAACLTTVSDAQAACPMP